MDGAAGSDDAFGRYVALQQGLDDVTAKLSGCSGNDNAHGVPFGKFSSVGGHNRDGPALLPKGEYALSGKVLTFW